jgi:hypothetical protein
MLNNNNHKNTSSSLTSCDYSEQLVSYIYGEIEAAEKPEFEAHLKKCRVCSEEVAAFTGVHFSISEWKSQEFSALETPRIEIPYEKKESPAPARVVSGVSGSWLDSLRGLFSLNPVWAGGATMAALGIFALVAFFGSNPGPVDELAEKGNKTREKQVVSPTAQNSAVITTTNDGGNKTPDTKTKESEPKEPDVILTNDTNPKNNRVEKVSDNPRPNKTAEKTEAPKTNRVKNTPKKDTPDADEDLTPSYADDEDDSLRLSDLFDEIDTE